MLFEAYVSLVLSQPERQPCLEGQRRSLANLRTLFTHATLVPFATPALDSFIHLTNERKSERSEMCGKQEIVEPKIVSFDR